MKRLFVLVLVGFGLFGCTALRETVALHQVSFNFDRITDVKVAGVSTTGKDSYTDVGVTDLAKLTAAVLAHDVQTSFVVHLKAENPSTNSVTARMVKLGWSFFLQDRKLVDGKLDQAYAFEPGKVVDVQVPLSFNAYEFYTHNAQDLFELGLAIAGVEGYTKAVRLDLTPTVNTDLGPTTYPTPITVTRTAGGS